MSYCPACGAALPGAAAFCSNCGASVTSPVQVLPPAPPAPPAPPTAPQPPTGEQPPTPFPPLVVPYPPAPARFDVPPAGWPGAGPPPAPGVPAPAPAGPGWFATFPWKDLVPAAWQSAAILGVLLLVTTVLVAVADGVWLPDGKHGDLGIWLSIAVLLISLAAGGSISGEISVGGEESAIAAYGNAGVHAMPFLLTVLLLAPIVFLVRRAERRAPAPRLTQIMHAATHGLSAAILIGFACLFVRSSRDIDGVSVRFGPDIAVSMFTALLLVGAASWIARATVAPAPIRPVLRELLHTVRLVTRQFVYVLIGAVVAGVVVLATHLDDLADSAGSLFGFLAAAAAALPAGALLILGVPVSASGTGNVSGLFSMVLGERLSGGTREASYGIVTDPSRWTLLLVVPVLATVWAAARSVLSRPVGEWRPRIDRGVVAGTAGVAALLFLVVAVAQRASASMTVGGGPDEDSSIGTYAAHAGPSLPAALLAGLCWGALAALAMRWAPSVALAVPKLITGLPGRIDDSWRPVLAGHAAPPPGVYSPRMAKLVAAVAAVLLLVVGLGVMAVSVIGSTFYSPSRAAISYLEAIGAGEAGDALSVLETLPEAGDRSLLTDQVLRSDGVVRPTGVRATSTDRSGDDVTVKVSFNLGAEKQEMSLLMRDDPERARFAGMPHWRIATAPGRIGNGYAESNFLTTVAGKPIGQSSAAFPGAYRATVSDPSGMYESATSTVVVTDGQVDVDDVTLTISQQAQDSVTAAVNAQIDTCVSNPDGVNCPFSKYDTPDYAYAKTITFTLVSQPVVRVVEGEGGLVVETVTNGQVKYDSIMSDSYFEDQHGTLSFDADASVDLSSAAGPAVSFR